MGNYDTKRREGAVRSFAPIIGILFGNHKGNTLRAKHAPQNRGMESKLFTLRDLANRFKRFGLSVAWLKAEADAGRIPCFKAGRKLLFDPDAVEHSLLHRARSTPGSEAAHVE